MRHDAVIDQGRAQLGQSGFGSGERVGGRRLEREVMEPRLGARPLPEGESDAGTVAQEGEAGAASLAAAHEVEAEGSGVERDRAVQVADGEADVAGDGGGGAHAGLQ